MSQNSSSTPVTTTVDSLKITKAFCESIANNPAAYSEVERQAADMVAGQLRHWIFDSSKDPNQVDGPVLTAQMAKHRLDSLKVATTPKIEELVEDRAQMAQDLANQAQLISDIAHHIKKLKLPAELTARLLASASVNRDEQGRPINTDSSVSRVA